MIILTREELEKLKMLTQDAQTTPVVGFSMKQMIGGKDWASQAWDLVRDCWEELGRKYGFDPRSMAGINSKTGEVVIGQAQE